MTELKYRILSPIIGHIFDKNELDIIERSLRVYETETKQILKQNPRMTTSDRIKISRNAQKLNAKKNKDNKRDNLLKNAENKLIKSISNSIGDQSSFYTPIEFIVNHTTIVQNIVPATIYTARNFGGPSKSAQVPSLSYKTTIEGLCKAYENFTAIEFSGFIPVGRGDIIKAYVPLGIVLEKICNIDLPSSCSGAFIGRKPNNKELVDKIETDNNITYFA